MAMTKTHLQIEIVGVGTEDSQKKNSLYFWVRFRAEEQAVKISAVQLTEKMLEESLRLGIDPTAANPCISPDTRTPQAARLAPASASSRRPEHASQS